MDGRIQILRNAPEAAFFLQTGRKNQRKREYAGIGISRFHKLRRLRNIFAENESVFYRIVHPAFAQRLFSCSPVGRMQWIRDGYFINGWLAQDCKTLAYIQAGIVSYPQNDFPNRVQIGATRDGEPFGFEFSRVLDVGREKNVKRRAIFDLRKEI